jgi:class 3 adenylate cyclase
MASSANADPIKRTSRGRKLTAVVYADMVGYSRLIGLDDAGTLKRLRTLRRALIDPAIREHAGTVVDSAGDSILMIFDSIDGAVRCAVKVQQQVPVYDGDQPPDRTIRFRVGITIGDVIADDMGYHGDGVNIAARLQAECPVGGICVSRAVRDHVHGRLNFNFEELGPLTLKNIARPVEAFVLRLNPSEPDPARLSRPSASSDTTGAAAAPGTSVIQAVNTPVGFFILVVLIVEAIIGVLAGLRVSADTQGLVRVMTAIIVLLIGVVALLAWLRPDSLVGMRGKSVPRLAPNPSASHFLKVFEKSNDFLATGDKYQFPSLLKSAKSEAWFVGTTFYISTAQYRDLLLSRLADGVDLNFLILDPEGEAISTMAQLLGVTKKELQLDCTSGIRVLDRTSDDARNANSRGALRIKLIDEPIQTRFYLFDPMSDDGYIYFIPLLNGTNSQTVPGFLVRGSNAGYCEAYLKGVLRMWNQPAAEPLAVWKAAHPNFQ